jgi:hypothetical protein
MAGKEIPISQEKIDEILKAITCQEYDFIRAKKALIQVEKIKLIDTYRYRLTFDAEDIFGVYFHNEGRSYRIRAISFGVDVIRIYVGR